MRSVRGVAIVAFLFIVGLVGLGSPVFAFLLLLIRVLVIVDLDGYSDVLV